MNVILDFFKLHGLKMDDHRPIVAFGKNTCHVHYFPEEKKSRKLKPGTLILLDIWARLNVSKAPYADFTWMFYYGDDEPDPAYKETIKLVRTARDKALSYIQKSLDKGEFPVGADCDHVARQYLYEKNVSDYFLHTLGHSLGTKSPHGVYGGLRPRTQSKLVPMLGYTVEPGLYFRGKYGCRSEIDFYINKKKKVVVTLPLQKKIEVIRP